MLLRGDWTFLVLITLAIASVEIPACGDSSNDHTGDVATSRDAEASDTGLGAGGSGAGIGSGGADTDASPPGSGGMSSAATDARPSSGDESGGTAGSDAAIGSADAGATSDAAGADASQGAAGTGAAGADGSAVDCGEGGCAVDPIAAHVHIYISNTCEVSVDPADVIIPQGQTVLFTYHNHSVDYEADVWMSYGGGYIGLAQGGTWTDPIERCSELFPYTAYADVSINGLGVNDPYCPGKRMTIHCE